MHVSNSEIQTFKRCKRKWWLTYYRRLCKVEERKTGALLLGTRVHEALAGLYSLEPKNPRVIIFQIYEDLKNSVDPESFEFDMEAINKEAALAIIMVEGYMEWLEDTGADDDYEVIDVEKEMAVNFAMPTSPENITVIGKLDARVRRRSDGRLLSMDHKTCASFEGLTRTLELLEQPLMYQLIERLFSGPDGEHVADGVFNMLRKVKRTANAKPPFYAREIIHHNEIELRNFWYKLCGIFEDMLLTEKKLNDGVDHHIAAYPTPHANCAWDCEFRAVCPMFDDGSHAEGLIESSYKVHDPYERYEMIEATL